MDMDIFYVKGSVDSEQYNKTCISKFLHLSTWDQLKSLPNELQPTRNHDKAGCAV